MEPQRSRAQQEHRARNHDTTKPQSQPTRQPQPQSQPHSQQQQQQQQQQHGQSTAAPSTATLLFAPQRSGEHEPSAAVALPGAAAAAAASSVGWSRRVNASQPATAAAPRGDHGSNGSTEQELALALELKQQSASKPSREPERTTTASGSNCGCLSTSTTVGSNSSGSSSSGSMALALATPDTVTRLTEQVALLMRCLEDEKKRRASEQQLMQQKILELQSLIRHNMPEQQLALERRVQTRSSPSLIPVRSATLRVSRQQLQRAQARSPYKTMKLLSDWRVERKETSNTASAIVNANVNAAALAMDELQLTSLSDENNNQSLPAEEMSAASPQLSPDASPSMPTMSSLTTPRVLPRGFLLADDADREAVALAVETKMKRKLTRLRARMHALVVEARQETQSLQQQIDADEAASATRERQHQLELSQRVAQLQDQHANATRFLTARCDALSAEVDVLQEDRTRLLQLLQQRDERIQQLELAVAGRRRVLTPSPPLS